MVFKHHISLERELLVVKQRGVLFLYRTALVPKGKLQAPHSNKVREIRKKKLRMSKAW